MSQGAQLQWQENRRRKKINDNCCLEEHSVIWLTVYDKSNIEEGEIADLKFQLWVLHWGRKQVGDLWDGKHDGIDDDINMNVNMKLWNVIF